MKNLIFLVGIILSSVIAYADYPSKVLYTCEASGNELDNISTNVQIQLKETTYPNQVGKFIVVDYISSWDKYQYKASIPVNDKSNSKQLKWSEQSTPKDWQFKRGDNFVVLNLSKKSTGTIKGQNMAGYFGKVGIKNAIRTVEASIFCAQ